MKITNKLVIALIGLLLVLAYGHAFNFTFQYDDYNVIVDEPKVHSLSAWWQSMPGMRSLLKLSYALNWQLESAPRFFRLFNLVCHFLTSLLVWRFCLKLLPYLKVNAQNHQAIALVTALLFALHPAHTEVATYISGRSTGLMSLLGMTSLLFFLAYLKQLTKPVYLLASVVIWLLAILVKEPAIVLPLLAWLLFKLVHPTASIYAGFKQLASYKKLLLILLFSAPIMYVWLVPQYANLVRQVFSPDKLYNQLLSQPVAHTHYLTQTLLGLNLNADYQLNLPKTFNLQAGLQAVWILVAGGMALIYFKRFPLVCFCVLWWFVCLIPSNSIIPRIDLISDRQIYLASIGALLLLATALVTLANRAKIYRLFWLLPVLILGYSLLATWLRNWDYENEITLWQASVRQAPNNARAWNNLGYAYKLDKQNEKAINAFENALKLDDSNYKAYYNLQQLKQH
jgi:tetratricopeptide (TPR) repeat protein